MAGCFFVLERRENDCLLQTEFSVHRLKNVVHGAFYVV
nr:MAG TPA: hypothetical protein [Bacteriophage sp.]